jgi:hypothetical protein
LLTLDDKRHITNKLAIEPVKYFY